jgi:hypothetical protein
MPAVIPGYEGLFLTAVLMAFVCCLSVIVSLRNLRLNQVTDAMEMVVVTAPDPTEKIEQSRRSS